MVHKTEMIKLLKNYPAGLTAREISKKLDIPLMKVRSMLTWMKQKSMISSERNKLLVNGRLTGGFPYKYFLLKDHKTRKNGT